MKPHLQLNPRRIEDGVIGDIINRTDMERAKLYPHFTQAFHDCVNQFGPNDFFILRSASKKNPRADTSKRRALLKLATGTLMYLQVQGYNSEPRSHCGKKLTPGAEVSPRVGRTTT